MAGHSHWAGIKRQKDVTDQKRARIFSKLLAAITAASRTEQNPEFNPRLRTAILKAKEESVPAENILRAIRRASDPGAPPAELTFEAYGPGGVAIIIEAIAENRNRAVAEIKKILSDHSGKWAESGSVRWAFEPGEEHSTWKAKFRQEIGSPDRATLEALFLALEEHDSVQGIFMNTE